MSQPCSTACSLSETLLGEVARLTGVHVDVVRIAHGLPVDHAEACDPRRVVLELPHGVDPWYERAAFLDAVARGEAPITSCALHAEDGVVDAADGRRIRAVWARYADATVVYADLGVTPGMQAAVDDARLDGRDVDVRYLGAPWA